MVSFKKPLGFGSPLIKLLEDEREIVYEGASQTPGFEMIGQGFLEYSLKHQITKFCQMGLNRSWQDWFFHERGKFRAETPNAFRLKSEDIAYAVKCI